MNEFFNRRTAERFKVGFDCQIMSGEETFEGTIENISLTGAEIKCPSVRWEEGKKVHLIIQGETEELRLPAQVLRETSGEGALGLRFIGDPLEAASKLGPMIRRATRSRK